MDNSTRISGYSPDWGGSTKFVLATFLTTSTLFDQDTPTVHTAPDCASSGGPFFIGSLFVIMMYLRGYLVISEAT